MKEKIALITAGGHVSNFHASMLQMARSLKFSSALSDKLELAGAVGGFQGFMEEKFAPAEELYINPEFPGSMFGSDRNNPSADDIARFPEIMRRNRIHSVIMMGGDNHLGVASKIHKQTGSRIIGWPKTMDGDLSSGVTLGYETAVSVAAFNVRNSHLDAFTNGTVCFTGLFGRDTDWVACGAGLCGGADLVIPCERKYSWKDIAPKIKAKMEENRDKYGRSMAVVPFSERIRIEEIPPVPERYAKTDAHGQQKIRAALTGYELEKLAQESGIKASSEVFERILRNSPPSTMDTLLAKIAGEECIKMIEDGDFGKSVAFEPNGKSGYPYKPVRKPLEKVAVKRFVSGTGYFDYDAMQPTQKFADDYGKLFELSLTKFGGRIPRRSELIPLNLAKR
jgi:6-phosphofructokinase 1